MDSACSNFQPAPSPSSHYVKAGYSLNFPKEIYLKHFQVSTKAFKIIFNARRPQLLLQPFAFCNGQWLEDLDKHAFSGTITASNATVTVMTHEAIKYTGCIDSASEPGIWAKIVAMVRNFIKNQVPEGYQDQKGFHFGVKQAE
jgi:hypothetical protein